jgi:hypothetical protein
MENLNRIKFHTNEKYKKQIVSLKYCFSKVYYRTKRRKPSKIEFYNYSKYSYSQLREHLSFFLIGILLVVGISAILLGNDDGINSLGQQVTYAQLTTSLNIYAEGHPLAPSQGYHDRHSERPSNSQVLPYFPRTPSHTQIPCH